jgi:hypothetical protein
MSGKTLAIILSIIMIALGIVFLVGLIRLTANLVVRTGEHLIGTILSVCTLILIVVGVIGLTLTHFLK